VTDSFDRSHRGSGHNGLVAAAYLAVAGERWWSLSATAGLAAEWLPVRLTSPGFRHVSIRWPTSSFKAPAARDDELKLKARYGLRYLFPILRCLPFPKTTDSFVVPDRERRGRTLRKFSRNDAMRTAGSRSRRLPGCR